MTNDTIEMPAEQFRLLVDLAGVSRNPRVGDAEIAPFLGGYHRANAARSAHDHAKALLREYDNG